MGNISNNNVNGRRRHGNHAQPLRFRGGNAFAFPFPIPQPSTILSAPWVQSPPAPAMPAPYDHRHRVDHPVAHWVGGRCPMMPRPAPYVEHQKAVTVRNDANLLKESLRFEQDEESPGSYFVTFRFDAAVGGR
ncbi:hypothetical protein OIU84_026110 [Salix udensis]|uniref:Uncharacterized protein n=1 Tax=Salix udensis TaxID=889485 RepID=A0AAD6PDW2_9ROSI|nr:hypothetical protein OIU84_026110 [Salix udensis]